MFEGRKILQIVILVTIQEITRNTDHYYLFNDDTRLKFDTRIKSDFFHDAKNSWGTNNKIGEDEKHCYAFNKNPYLKFGTRTSYEFVRGRDNFYKTIPHCKPIQIWMLIRHGTKYPGAAKITLMKNMTKFRDEIIQNHEKHGYGHLCKADLENLKLWRLNPDVRLETKETLTEQGFEEMNQLGNRVKNNVPELFPPVISNVSSADYKFRSADKERMDSSKIAFMSGLLNRVDIPDADRPANDTLFASYDNCPRWDTEVGKNPEVVKEVTKFKDGPEYQNMISKISRRLGFLNVISADSVDDMWSVCRYEKAWRIRDLSPWCAVFSDTDLEILEYEEDLKDYYRRGYGHEYNIRLGCPPLRHLFQHFHELEGSNYSSKPKGVFNLVRSGSLHLFMAAMGFAKDSTHPLASGFSSRSQRQWKTSEIGSFAANIAAVFHKCEDARSPNKVVFYLAEKLVNYDGCEAGVCDWEYLKNKFPNATSDCDSDFCYPDSSDIRSTTIS